LFPGSPNIPEIAINAGIPLITGIPSIQGVKPDAQKIKTVKEFPRSRNSKNIK